MLKTTIETHRHPHEPVREMQPKLPKHVIEILSLSELSSDVGLTTVEEQRLKLDELKSRGLTEGASYYERRLMMVIGVLKDRRLIAEKELLGKIKELDDGRGKKGEAATKKTVRALVALLIEKGLVKKEQLRSKFEEIRARTPMTGARIVARAWIDGDFKRRLKNDAKRAIVSMGKSLLATNSGESLAAWRITRLEILENSENVRNVVVCTLCSCYPRGLLGEPPEWYTSDTYKKRIVTQPRKVLEEMGTRLTDDTEVRVYDSTADIRYMVLPLRPKGSEHLSERQLAKLVTRDSLIGVSDPKLLAR